VSGQSAAGQSPPRLGQGHPIEVRKASSNSNRAAGFRLPIGAITPQQKQTFVSALNLQTTPTRCARSLAKNAGPRSSGRSDQLRLADIGDICATDEGAAVIHGKGKGGKERGVPIEAALLAVIERYLNRRALRFPDARKRITTGSGAAGLSQWPATDAALPLVPPPILKPRWRATIRCAARDRQCKRSRRRAALAHLADCR
jgi:hypothetical protein